jgi:adenylate kinase
VGGAHVTASLVSQESVHRAEETPIVVVLGPPGSGKGTQCEHLARALGLGHVSTGQALRDEIGHGTRLGVRAAQYVESGRLVPDDIVVQAMTAALARCPRSPGVLLDGFPRTEAQAALLDELGLGTVRLAAALVVPRAVLLERLRSRGRADDRVEVVRTRLLSYEVETRPLLDYYVRRGTLVHVDGNRAAAEVTATLTAQLAHCGITSGRQRTGIAALTN